MPISRKDGSPERPQVPLSAIPTQMLNPLSQPAPAPRQFGLSLPSHELFDAQTDTGGPAALMDRHGFAAGSGSSAFPSGAGVTIPLASQPPMAPRIMLSQPSYREGFSEVPPDLAKRLAELANPPGRTLGANGAGAVKSAPATGGNSATLSNSMTWPKHPERGHLVTLPPQQAEALLQAWRAAGRNEQQSALPLNPLSVNARFHDFGAEATSDFASVATASGVRPPPFPPLPPSLEPLPRARSGGLGDIRPTSMAGLGNQLFGLAFSKSKFGSVYSQSEASDGEWDRFSKVLGADADDPYPRTRRKGMIRINSDGTAKVGRFRISDCGITTPVRGERPVHATIPFRSAFLRLEVVGKGASGEVYKAVHVPTLTLVAAKTIYYVDKGRHHDLASELESLWTNRVDFGASNSPPPCSAVLVPATEHIVSFYDAYVDLKEDSLTLILEYMDAGTLQDMVETGGVQSESVLANISLQVLRGLDFLHRKRIVHRDIKPANILVNHDGVVKLSDFGVARVMAAHEAAVKSNLGTFAFFSPERLHGDQYDFSSDIWSMGITLLTLALGRFPVAAEHTRTELALYGYLESDQLQPTLARLPPAFADFVSNCLVFSAGFRPKAHELLQHPFLARASAISIAPSEESTSSSFVARSTMLELQDMAQKVQRYRLYASLRGLDLNVPQIPPIRFEALAKQLGIPAARVAQTFNMAQRNMEDKFRRSVMRRLANDESRK